MKNQKSSRDSTSRPNQNQKPRLRADYIRQEVDPKAFYKHELPGVVFKKVVWNDAGLCVFHTDTQAGSFRVNLVTGQFRCFSCCASGGSVIDFVMLRYSLTFKEALEKLSSVWGVR
jgi:DNA primase